MEKYLENQKKILKNLIKCFNLIEKKVDQFKIKLPSIKSDWSANSNDAIKPSP